MFPASENPRMLGDSVAKARRHSEVMLLLQTGDSHVRQAMFMPAYAAEVGGE